MLPRINPDDGLPTLIISADPLRPGKSDALPESHSHHQRRGLSHSEEETRQMTLAELEEESIVQSGYREHRASQPSPAGQLKPALPRRQASQPPKAPSNVLSEFTLVSAPEKSNYWWKLSPLSSAILLGGLLLATSILTWLLSHR